MMWTGEIKITKEKYKAGDLAYCDVLEVAKHEWGFRKLMNIDAVLDTWPRILCVVIETRETLKVAKVFVPELQVSVRAPYKSLYLFEEEKLG